MRSVFDKNGFFDKKIASPDRKIIRSSQQILQETAGPGQARTNLTHLANSSTFSPGSNVTASDSIAGRGLRLLIFVIVKIQVSKVDDVIILILKADLLTQAPGNGIIKV